VTPTILTTQQGPDVEAKARLAAPATEIATSVARVPFIAALP
jgi:hypothetical protein